LADLSDVDRTYLLAMAQDQGPSSTGQIAKRLGVSAHYASVYRGRLIDAGVIEATRYGYVDFAIPYLREYLREHAAGDEIVIRHAVEQPNADPPLLGPGQDGAP
jgi:DNA-binding Lrp family transcriptional regulator